jgi:hypothetical protein
MGSKKNANSAPELVVVDPAALAALGAQAPAEDTKPAEAPVITRQEEVIKAAPTFDATFETDPLRDKMKAWAERVRSDNEGADKAFAFVIRGQELNELLKARFDLAPASYNRSSAIKLAETALALIGLSEDIRATEMLQSYWFVNLLRSTPGDKGNTRTYAKDKTIPSDFFTGNFLKSVVRELDNTIEPMSKDGELEVWDFRAGFEGVVRGWVDQLRAGELTLRMVKDLIKFRAKELKEQREAEKYAGLNQDEIAERKQAAIDNEEKARLASLKKKLNDAAEFSRDKLNYDKVMMRDLMIGEKLIPPVLFNPKEVATNITPGDARAVILEISTLIRKHGKKERNKVLRTMWETLAEVAPRMGERIVEPESKRVKTG